MILARSKASPWTRNGGSWTRGAIDSRFKADAENGVFDLLLVHDLSRFAREEELGHAIFNMLIRYDLNLVNASNNIDYRTRPGAVHRVAIIVLTYALPIEDGCQVQVVEETV